MHRDLPWHRIARRLLILVPLITLATLQVALSPVVQAQQSEPSIKFFSPKEGEVITENAIPIVVEIKNWKIDCDLSGTPNKAGVGHWHLEVDKGLIDMICFPFHTLSLQNIKPGAHTLKALPAMNDHEELEKNAAQVTFTYQPTNPQHAIPGINVGKPSVTILWPKNGATVSGSTFPLLFDVRNFRLSCDLLGRPLVANTGHWHVNVDTSQGPMMGMMTMLRMGCTNSFEVPLAGITPGKHRIIVLLVDNLHAPLKPAIEASVTVTVKK